MIMVVAHPIRMIVEEKMMAVGTGHSKGVEIDDSGNDSFEIIK